MLKDGPYDPKTTEKAVLEYWLKNKFYKPEYSPKENRVLSTEEMKADSREAWALICPPPNAYARPHIGNISGYAYQDAMARYQRMQGKKVLVIPGKDHAGLEGEGVFVREVLEKQGRSKFDMTREEFYKEIWDFNMINKAKAMNDEMNIGLSADFDRDTFTLDPDIVKTVLDTFVEMYNAGMIYKGVRIVNWDPKARTAVADNQVEFIDNQTPFFYFKYGLFNINPERKIWKLSFYKDSIFNAIKAGTKTVETRALNPEEPDRFFGNIKTGDVIVCVNKNSGEEFYTLAKDVRMYKNADEFLKGEDFSKILSNGKSYSSTQELIDSYNKLAENYGNKLNQNGAVAIEIEKFSGDPESKALELKREWEGKELFWKVQESSDEKAYLLGEHYKGTKILGIAYDKVPAGTEVGGVVIGVQMRLDGDFRLVVRGIDFEGDLDAEITKASKQMFGEVAGAHIIEFAKYPEDKFYTNGFIIGTVRPETIFADTGIACGIGDERYSQFVGKTVEVEFLGQRKVLQFVEDYTVDKEFGTGLLKVTPAHAVEDWEIAQRHPECLPAIQVIGYDLKLNSLCGVYSGLKIKDARLKMQEDMRESGNLVYVDENYKNKIKIAERTKAPIEPLLSSQWYLKYDAPGNNIKEAALEMVNAGIPVGAKSEIGNQKSEETTNHKPQTTNYKHIQIHPDSQVDKFNNWMNNLRDWAISRSLWWGYRLPVWYSGEVREIIDEKGQVREEIRISKSENSNKSQTSEVSDSDISASDLNYEWVPLEYNNPNHLRVQIERPVDSRQLTADSLTVIDIMRHSESIANQERVLAGAEYDCDLTQKGILEAENVKLNEQYDVIISSPLLRAKKSAQIIIDKNNLNHKIIEEPLIIERNFKALTKKKHEDVAKEFGIDLKDMYNQMDLDAEKFDIESLTKMQERTQRFIDKIKSEYPGKKILVVAHGGIIRAFYKVLKGFSADDLEKNNIDDKNLSIHRFKIKSTDSRQLTADNWHQDENVLDTWFSSGQWVYATLTKYNLMDTFFPTNALVSAHDILENWDSRMMMFTYFKHKNIPFENLFLTGLVLGTDGQKMSKSKGNMIDMDKIVAEYGTDAVRMSYFYQNKAGGNYAITPDKLKNFKQFINKLWNASKFVMMNLDLNQIKNNFSRSFFDSAQNDTNGLKLEISKKILAHIQEVKEKVTKNIEDYEFGYATENLYDSFWKTFCDVLIEESKKYTNTIKDKETGVITFEPNQEEKLEVQTVLIYTLKEYLKMLHPFVPFVTQTIWNEVPKVEGDHETVMYSRWRSQ